MKFGKLLLIVLLLVLSGCNIDNTYNSSTPNSTPDTIAVYGRNVSVEEINQGIQAAFNTVLYYYGDGQFYPFLNKTIEYELFFDPNTQYRFFPQVYMIVLNAENPLSTDQTPRLYKFSISVTENGLQSYFHEQSHVTKQDTTAYLEDGASYLGRHSMCISEVVPPTHEKMSDAWKQSVGAALRLYMDKNNFYSEPGKNLPAGKYRVHVQGFSECDTDSTIIFEHENGTIYTGIYLFVHDITEGKPADLNHVELVENAEPDYMEYLNKIRLNAAFSMEYAVKG